MKSQSCIGSFLIILTLTCDIYAFTSGAGRNMWQQGDRPTRTQARKDTPKGICDYFVDMAEHCLKREVRDLSNAETEMKSKDLLRSQARRSRK